MEPQEKLKSLLTLLQNDTLTPKEVHQFLTLVLGVIRESKKSFDEISQQNLKEVSDALDSFRAIHMEGSEIMDEKASNILSQINTKLKEVDMFLANVKKIKTTPGKPGAPGAPGVSPRIEDIVEEVVKQLPPPQAVEEMNAAAIADLLETLQGEYRLDYNALKNTPDPATGRAPGGSTARFLHQLQDILITDLQDGDALVYDADLQQWVNSTGGGSGTVGPGTINEIAYFDTTTSIASLPVATYPSLTELSYVKGATSSIQTQLGTKAPTTSPTFATSITGSYLTASEMLITDGSKNIISAAVATYPSLTELTYLKGVTSSIQTQLNAFVNGMIYKGNWDASAGTFPGGGVAQTGWFYTVSVGGTVDSVVFNVGDRVIATTNNASTTTYAANWTQLDATDAVTSVFGRVGNVVSTNGDYTASQITNVAAGNISSVTVQAALNELDTEKQAIGNYITALTGDGTASGPGSVAFTLATVNGNVGSFGSATAAPVFTVNAKGLITAASSSTITPAIGSITGLGTGVATALGVNIGSAGAFVTFNGALGTPSSGTVTNLTGTASININGTVGATTPTTIVGTTIQANTGFSPDVDDGAYLGQSGTAFSDLFLASGGVINWNAGDVTATHSANTLTFAGASSGYAFDARVSASRSGGSVGLFTRTDDSSSVAVISFAGDRATPTNGDNGYFSYELSDAAGSQVEVARSYWSASDVTAGAVTSNLYWSVRGAGTLTRKLQLNFDDLSPFANDILALGNTSNMWSDLFLASGSVVNFNNGNVTLTHSSGALTLAGGNLNLGENTSVALDPALSADGKWTGITRAGTAGATIAFGDLCYLAAVDSRWELADADAAATSGDVILGMCVLAAAADGDPTVMLLIGNIRADTAFPALTIGAPAYVGTTAGDIQTAQPSGTDDVIRRVGFALTADELYFNPSNDYITHT